MVEGSTILVNHSLHCNVISTCNNAKVKSVIIFVFLQACSESDILDFVKGCSSWLKWLVDQQTCYFFMIYRLYFMLS